MAKNHGKPINMDSNTFYSLKADMTEELNKLIRVMQGINADDATMTVKISLHLESGDYGDVPTVKHKVTTSVTRKSEKAGEMDGEYVIEDDGEGGHYLKPLSTQMDMMEEYEEEEEDEEEEEEEEDV